MNSPSGFVVLPLDLLLEICSFLVGPLSGLPYSTGLHSDEVPTYPPSIAAGEVLHPFYSLAASCRILRHAVEWHCRHLLIRHQSITKIKLPAADQRFDTSSADPQKKTKEKKGDCRTVYRVLWVKWAKRHCGFCGKRSSRRAIFNTLIRCCQKCDGEQWRDKITMSQALKKYHLTKLDLFTPNPTPLNVHVPRTRYATYDSGIRNDTTMFLQHDVERLAEMIHGAEKRMRAKRQTRRQGIQWCMDLEFRHGRRRSWMKVAKATSYGEEFTIGDPCTCETGGREISIAEQERKNAQRLATLQRRIDKRCFACRYDDVMQSHTQMLDGLLRADALLPPAETEPAVRSATIKMVDDYLSSLTKENNWGHAGYDPGIDPLPSRLVILDSSCQLVEARWRRW